MTRSLEGPKAPDKTQIHPTTDLMSSNWNSCPQSMQHSNMWHCMCCHRHWLAPTPPITAKAVAAGTSIPSTPFSCNTMAHSVGILVYPEMPRLRSAALGKSAATSPTFTHLPPRTSVSMAVIQPGWQGGEENCVHEEADCGSCSWNVLSEGRGRGLEYKSRLGGWGGGGR